MAELAERTRRSGAARRGEPGRAAPRGAAVPARRGRRGRTGGAALAEQRRPSGRAVPPRRHRRSGTHGGTPAERHPGGGDRSAEPGVRYKVAKVPRRGRSTWALPHAPRRSSLAPPPPGRVRRQCPDRQRQASRADPGSLDENRWHHLNPAKPGHQAAPARRCPFGKPSGRIPLSEPITSVPPAPPPMSPAARRGSRTVDGELNCPEHLTDRQDIRLEATVTPAYSYFGLRSVSSAIACHRSSPPDPAALMAATASVFSLVAVCILFTPGVRWLRWVWRAG